ncbi:MAG: amidohydrolase family protein [Planctomycetota bacterium]|nr:amidohydrolase family protein [Planctomycetota bacterium]
MTYQNRPIPIVPSMACGFPSLMTMCVVLGWMLANSCCAEPPTPAATPPVGAPADVRPAADDRLALDAFRPQSMLRVPASRRTHAKFPVVDVHTHFSVRLQDLPAQLDETVAMLDRHHVVVAVSLDGTLGDRFEQHKTDLWTKYRHRFVIFANIDWRGTGGESDPSTWDCHRDDFAHRTAKQLEIAKQAGASGLKVFKQLGLTYRNPDGTLVQLDDARWDPIWQACGTLGLPVLIHAADPEAFFRPVDAQNERWEELKRHPDWSFHGGDFPSHGALLEAFLRIVARHPKTTFIGAHMANNPEDLGKLAEWLDRYPNLNVEIASRISELGRQPYTARKFLIQYADRVMFGTDGPWPSERLSLYWRFLETYDEYFPYSERPFPPQGFWNIYGLGLPDAVLRKIYHENAARIIPGVAERIRAQETADEP